MFSSSIYIVTCVKISFLFKGWMVLLYKYTLFCLFESSINGYLNYFHVLVLKMILLWTWVYKHLFNNPCSVLLVIQPKVKLLHHIISPFLTFWGLLYYFPLWLFHFTFLPTVHEGSSCPYSHKHFILIWLFFLSLSYRTFLYFLEINPLSDIQFTDLFCELDYCAEFCCIKFLSWNPVDYFFCCLQYIQEIIAISNVMKFLPYFLLKVL